MLYELKDNRTGESTCRPTTVEITGQGGEVTFFFRAENSQRYCAYEGYNQMHCEGDVCEIFIGTDPRRKVYYEIEISPRGDIFLAKITYGGTDSEGIPILQIDYLDDNFLTTSVTETETGYTAEIRLRLEDICTGDGEIFFNAYRIETDGGESDKHLIALCPTMRSRFHVPQYYALLQDYLK